jgi:hypothetical protein
LEWRPFQAFGFLTKPGEIEPPDNHNESCNYVEGNCHAFLLSFAVHRSPFTVHRFTVRRSQGIGSPVCPLFLTDFKSIPLRTFA